MREGVSLTECVRGKEGSSANQCIALSFCSTASVSESVSCMAAVLVSCASAGPIEPTAPTRAQHVARWINVAEIPTWAQLRVSCGCHSVRKHLLCV